MGAYFDKAVKVAHGAIQRLQAINDDGVLWTGLYSIAATEIADEAADVAQIHGLDSETLAELLAPTLALDNPFRAIAEDWEGWMQPQLKAALRLASHYDGPELPVTPQRATETATERLDGTKPSTALAIHLRSILSHLDSQPLRIVASVIKSVLAHVGDTSTVAEICRTTSQLYPTSASSLRKVYSDPYGGIAKAETVKAYQREADRLTSAIVATLDN